MPEVERVDIGQHGAVLYVHFDVAEHSLNLDTFVQTALRIQSLTFALDNTLFAGAFSPKIVVLAPEPGTFLQRFMLVCASVGSLMVGVKNFSDFAEGEIATRYIQGLTGKSVGDWMEELGEKHHEILASKDNTPTSHDDSEIVSQDEWVPSNEAKIITSLAKCVLERSNEEIEAIDADLDEFADVLDARSEFYEVCLADSEIKNVGFDPSNQFPVSRSSFAQRAIKRERRSRKEEKEPEWFTSIEEVFAFSPQWEREDQKNRRWKGRTLAKKTRHFEIDDAEFWARVKSKSIKTETIDRLKVQWAFQIVDGRPQSFRVLRVLEFNGEKLADPLSADAVSAILGIHHSFEGSSQERTLFDFLDDEDDEGEEV